MQTHQNVPSLSFKWPSDMTGKIDDRVKEIGRTQRHRYEGLTLPVLAIAVAEAARDGEVNEDVAGEVYAIYIQESTGQKPVPSEQSFRVNASKLRQIIRAKSPALLRKVAKLHGQVREKIRVRPLYPAMVDACRALYHTGKMPSDRQLLAIVSRVRRHPAGCERRTLSNINVPHAAFVECPSNGRSNW